MSLDLLTSMFLLAFFFNTYAASESIALRQAAPADVVVMCPASQHRAIAIRAEDSQVFGEWPRSQLVGLFAHAQMFNNNNQLYTHSPSDALVPEGTFRYPPLAVDPTKPYISLRMDPRAPPNLPSVAGLTYRLVDEIMSCLARDFLSRWKPNTVVISPSIQVTGNDGVHEIQIVDGGVLRRPRPPHQGDRNETMPDDFAANPNATAIGVL